MKEFMHSLMEKLKKKGADDIILTSNSSEDQLIKFANNKIATTKSINSKYISIFATKDKKIIVTTMKDFSEKGISDITAKIMKNLSKLQKNKDYHGISKGKFSYRTIQETYDPKIESFNEEMIDYVKQSMDNKLRNAGTFEKTIAEAYLLTSNGTETTEKGTSLYFSIRSFADKESSGASTCVSRMKSKLNFLESSNKASEIAKLAKLKKQSLQGKFTVFFEPLAFATVIENLGESASIFTVESGLSCLKDKLNKKIMNNNITIYDDATIPNGFNSSSCDAEGTPSQKNTIIENGKLKTYLHNYSTAKKYKTKSTANAGLISPSPSNLYLKEGSYSKDEMFQGIKKGLFITNVWYTRFQNHQTGDFSTIPRDGAFYIENGKIKHALKDIRISDNLLNLMNNITHLGNKVEQIKSWEVSTPTFLPYIVVKDVNITRPE